MFRRPNFTPILSLLAVITGCATAYGIVIDDFSVGDIVVQGPTVIDQLGLDAAHVIGGTRRIDVGRFGTGSRFEIADGRLQFSSTGMGYLTLTYGADQPLGGLNLAKNGHDRIRIRFGDVSSTYLPMAMYVNLPTSSSSNGVSWQVKADWDGIVVEIPYSAFPAALTEVQTITFDAHRNPAGTGFDLESITTAGPSLAGDFNRDGLVDGDDLAELARYMGVTTSNGAQVKVLAAADANADGRVDGADFLAWQRLVVPLAGATSVPEPAASLLACWLMLSLSLRAGVRIRRGV